MMRWKPIECDTYAKLGIQIDLSRFYLKNVPFKLSKPLIFHHHFTAIKFDRVQRPVKSFSNYNPVSTLYPLSVYFTTFSVTMFVTVFSVSSLRFPFYGMLRNNFSRFYYHHPTKSHMTILSFKVRGWNLFEVKN